jgi:hypothetical protein
MPAANYNFIIEQGTSFKLALTYKNANHDIVDLTNWCARLIMNPRYNNPTKIFSTTNLDHTLYHFYIDGPNGKIVLLIPAETTNGFVFDVAKYELELQSPDDFYTDGGKYTTRVLEGVITIKKRNSEYSETLDCQ